MVYTEVIKQFLVAVLITCVCAKSVELKSDNPQNQIGNKDSGYPFNVQETSTGIRSVGSRGTYQHSNEKIKTARNFGRSSNNGYIKPNLNDLLDKLPTRGKLFSNYQTTTVSKII
ncbi:hypothetical protein PPYR_11195 [Photinus pyralis]|uniref:Attacin C-terminal domain-containing protein n=1 Tax=Photinus pyralis TaxID=7054 RepID=A0A1Y1KT00_PHOPY|nr:hypothetical protein PPYR_11195 [Photinus pyralis]